jgi:hypothetical protein
VTTYTVAWGIDEVSETGQQTIEVTTPEELDAALDRVHAESEQPILVDIYPSDWTGLVPPGLQLGLGHPERALLVYADAEGSAYAIDPAIPDWPETITFEYGGQPTEVDPQRVRATPKAVRQAAREYIETGQRSTCLRWE